MTVHHSVWSVECVPFFFGHGVSPFKQIRLSEFLQEFETHDLSAVINNGLVFAGWRADVENKRMAVFIGAFYAVVIQACHFDL